MPIAVYPILPKRRRMYYPEDPEAVEVAVADAAAGVTATKVDENIAVAAMAVVAVFAVLETPTTMSTVWTANARGLANPSKNYETK